MGGVNQTRGGMAQNVTDATEHARLIGFNDEGLACVWSGGYTFNVYDAARDWNEVTAFTSGQMAGLTDYDSPEAYGYAKERMKSEGYEPVE